MSAPDAGLQTVLAAEHAAVYLYGVLGARSQGKLTARLRSGYDAHIAARDALADRVRASGSTPVGPAAGYTVPAGWTGDTALEAGALGVEQRCTAAYVAQVGAVTGKDRMLLMEGAASSAVRELDFGGRPAALPGLATRG